MVDVTAVEQPEEAKQTVKNLAIGKSTRAAAIEIVNDKFPKINWLSAAIYARKKQLNLTWIDIANAAGTTSQYLRNLEFRHPNPWDWPDYTLKKVCRVLGIEIREYVAGSPDDPTV